MNPILAIECPHCRAAVGQRCSVPYTDQSLSLSVAHPSRMERAGMVPSYGAVTKYRELWADVDTSGPERRTISRDA